MNNIKGKRVVLDGITSSEAFAEASLDELKALVALIEANGKISGAPELAKMAGISKIRATAALTLWEAAGIFSDKEEIEYEFENRISFETDEENAVDVADTLRNEKIKILLEEIASLLGRPALNTAEIKRITAMVTQLALTEEYILTLAAYLEEKGKLTVLKLHRKAEELSSGGVDTTEDLQIWIQEKSKKPLPHHVEFSKGMDYPVRTLTRTERDYADRWVNCFGYGAPVISEALNITMVNTGGKKSLAYIDRLLEAWHGAGCKTVEECMKKYADDKPNSKTKPKAKPSDSKAPKFSDFNADDALMKALERSYGKSEDTADK